MSSFWSDIFSDFSGDIFVASLHAADVHGEELIHVWKRRHKICTVFNTWVRNECLPGREYAYRLIESHAVNGDPSPALPQGSKVVVW